MYIECTMYDERSQLLLNPHHPTQMQIGRLGKGGVKHYLCLKSFDCSRKLCVYIHLLSHLTFHLFRRLLMCRVTLGKPVEQYNAIKIAHAPPGHHSVIGRPSAGGLNYPEYAIYRGEQVCKVHVYHEKF